MASVTQISWKKALGVSEARLAAISPEHSTKLRQWKEIVAGVYLDFATKYECVLMLFGGVIWRGGTPVLPISGHPS